MSVFAWNMDWADYLTTDYAGFSTTNLTNFLPRITPMILHPPPRGGVRGGLLEGKLEGVLLSSIHYYAVAKAFAQLALDVAELHVFVHGIGAE